MQFFAKNKGKMQGTLPHIKHIFKITVLECIESKANDYFLRQFNFHLLHRSCLLWKTIPTLLSQTVPRIGTFQMWKAHKQCFMQCTNDAKKSKMSNHVRSKLNFWWAIYRQARSESREIVLVETISGSDKKVATSFRSLARYFLPSHYTHSAHCYLRDEPKQRQQKDVGVCVFTVYFPDKESLLRWIQMFATLVD